MPTTIRSHLTVAVVAALLAAFVATGLQAAFADDSGPDTRAVVAADFYSRTNVTACPVGGGDCAFDKVKVNCRAGDEVVGGIGWAVSPTDRVVNLAADGLVDLPYRTRGWQVSHPEDTLSEGWTAKARVYCANTG